VSTIQGDFLSPSVQAEVRAYVQDPERGRPRKGLFDGASEDARVESADVASEDSAHEETDQSYVQLERSLSDDNDSSPEPPEKKQDTASMSRKQRDQVLGRVVDVVLSDMSEPWDQTSGFGKRSISNAYNRMMNTTGVAFKDHVGSMVSLTPVSYLLRSGLWLRS